jgi:histidinol-phosphate aminotransferase
MEVSNMTELSSMSRRRFARLMGIGAAAVAARPALALTRPLPEGAIPAFSTASAVRLSANENPYGPSPRALKAMTEGTSLVWKYPDDHADMLIEALARVNGVTGDQILLGNGSGEILKVCAAAFTGPTMEDDRAVELAKPSRGREMTFVPGRGKLVVADPTFEAILNHARINRAEVVRVPLTKNYAHDLSKMMASAEGGLIYICNPNNPTASITPKAELRDFISKVPKQTIILVDEAYHHYVDSSDYESLIPMVKNHPNLMVARTFSKIYGMAGLRCGYGVAQRETIAKLRPHQTWDSVNVMALVAAIASVNDSDQVTNGRRLNSQTKRFVVDEVNKLGFESIPSHANFVMIDVKRSVLPVLGALRQRGVYVGRLFPALPNHMRVTIGKQSEMETFVTAFREAVRSA